MTLSTAVLCESCKASSSSICCCGSGEACRPRPVRIRKNSNEALSASVSCSADAAAGACASASWARNSPRPRRLLSCAFSFALPNNALRIASTRIHPFGYASTAARLRCSQSAAAAATCGVAAEVPWPSKSMISLQPHRAHGTFGVGAAMAVFILGSGP